MSGLRSRLEMESAIQMDRRWCFLSHQLRLIRKMMSKFYKRWSKNLRLRFNKSDPN